MPTIVYIKGDDEPKRLNGSPAEIKKVLDDKYSQIRNFAARAKGDASAVISLADRQITDPDNRKVFANLMMKSNPIGSVRDKIKSFMDYRTFDLPEGAKQITPGDIASLGLSVAPGIGDLQSGSESLQYAEEGRPGMSALAALGALPGIPSVAGIFAGKAAKTANLEMLQKAGKMFDSGASRDDIWRETGWFQGADGNWRFEIDDSASKAKELQEWGWGNTADYEQSGKATGALGDFIEHPELAKNYGGMLDFGDGNTRMTMGVSKNMPGGSFNPKTGHIELGIDVDNAGATSPDRSSALHELQHAIQQREGFAGGGSPGEFNKTFTEHMEFLNSNKARKKELIQARYEMEDLIDEGVPRNIAIERVAKSDPIRMYYLNSLDNPILRADTSFNAYKNMAGETEARLVEKRMNMTPAERAARAPWLDYDVPESDQIVK